jgi:hypothetical protein
MIGRLQDGNVERVAAARTHAIRVPISVRIL